MKKIYFILSMALFACLVFPTSSRAQWPTYPITASGVTATTMMNKLLGPGVVAFGATSTCHDSSKGTFRLLAPSTLMFDSGVVMSSGRVRTWNPPPMGTGSFGMDAAAANFASWDNLMPGATWLGALTGGVSHNACYFEFDFKPAGDTVKFDYVFGSEEYADYACTPFNDPFGFLISGPGYASPTNIALVPGTSIPVCINSINCGPTTFGTLATCTAMGPGSPFCMYYVDNLAGTLLTYDGVTKKLTAIAAVTPCDTYHLKLGVADINDGIYDSGVWLRAGSLTSAGLTVSPVGMNPGDTVAGTQFCVRGCLPGKFVFRRSGSLVNPMTIHYIIGGTAVNGTDYTFIPDSVVIAASDSDEVVLIHGLPVTPTGPKTVKIMILAPYTCGGTAVVVDSAMITIIDSFYVKINTSDTSICQGEFVNISASGDTFLNYSWSPGGTLSSTTILNPRATPTVTMTYTLTGIFPAPGCLPSRDIIKITVYDRPILDAGPATQITCQGTAIQLNVIAYPTGIPYTYSWTPSTYLSPSATVANPKFTPLDSIDRIQRVTVTAPVPGCSSDTTFLLHVLPNDFALYNLDTGVCYPPQSYQIRILGDTEFSYKWTPNIGVSDPNIMDPVISPEFTQIYTVTASYPKCPDMKHTVLYSIEHPQVDILTADTIVCLGMPMPISVLVTPADSPFTFAWTPTANLVDKIPVVSPFFFTKTPGTYKYEIEVKSGLGCNYKDSIKIVVAPPVHIVVKPGNTTIKYGSEIQLEAIRLSPDPLFYTWVPNDGSLTNPNINNPIAKPLDSTTYIVYGMNIWGCRDSALVVIDVETDMTEYIPTAFTPNGDGLNDWFRIRGLKYQRIVDFKIYNRWGEMIYDYKTGDAQGWDGTFKGQPADMGVYNYSIILAKPGEIDKIYKGNVTLIR